MLHCSLLVWDSNKNLPDFLVNSTIFVNQNSCWAELGEILTADVGLLRSLNILVSSVQGYHFFLKNSPLNITKNTKQYAVLTPTIEWISEF